MSRHVNRPTYQPGMPLMAAKVITLNGERLLPGNPIDDVQREATGERRLRQLYEARLFDVYADGPLPPNYEIVPEEGAVIPNANTLVNPVVPPVSPAEPDKPEGGDGTGNDSQTGTAGSEGSEPDPAEAARAAGVKAELDRIAREEAAADARVAEGRAAAQAAAAAKAATDAAAAAAAKRKSGKAKAAPATPPADTTEGEGDAKPGIRGDSELVNKGFGKWYITTDGVEVDGPFSKAEGNKRIDAVKVRGG